MATSDATHRRHATGRREGRALALPGAAAAGAVVLSGVLLWLASPSSPLEAGWLAWVALVPVATVALASPEERRIGRLAVPLAYGLYLELLLVPALPLGIATGQWGDPALPVMVGDSPVVGVALFAIPLLVVLLYLLRFGQPWVPNGTPGWLAGVLTVTSPALAWTALDFVRVRLDPGGYFGTLFATQHDTEAVATAALGGPWALTFAIVVVNYSLALLAGGRSRFPALATAGLGLAATVLVGTTVAPSDEPDSVTVAAVQPGFNRVEYGERFDGPLRTGSEDRAALPLIEDLAPLTRDAARRGAEVIVWPEATVWVDPREDEAVGEALSDLAADTGTALIVPFFVDRTSSGASLVVSASGELGDARPKQRPMWFLGERGDRDGPDWLDADGLGIATLLGVDNEAPHTARQARRAGAALLASSTHDWEQLATFQRAHARVSAAANGAPLVRSDWRFGSAVFDARGRTVADAGTSRSRSVTVAEVQTGTRTVYVRVGDAFAWAALALALALRAAGEARGYTSRVAPTRRKNHP